MYIYHYNIVPVDPNIHPPKCAAANEVAILLLYWPSLESTTVKATIEKKPLFIRLNPLH
jgi:hypothetical protein